jgi:hypothetical protein
MNNQERDVITGIFQRLEQAANQPRDPEAERFIADRIRQQPYAPYAMAQTIYVQEEAMKSLQEQIEQLRAENEQLRSQGGQSGGFLSSIFGGGGRDERPGAFSRAPGGQQGYAGPQGGPWGNAPQGGGGPWGQQQGFAPQRQGSGFLGSALTTAAGVAGGMVVGNALMNAFSGGHSSLGSLGGGDGGLLGGTGLGGATAASGSDSDWLGGGGNDASVQDAAYDDTADLGGSGGSDDWS